MFAPLDRLDDVAENVGPAHLGRPIAPKRMHLVPAAEDRDWSSAMCANGMDRLLPQPASLRWRAEVNRRSSDEAGDGIDPPSLAVIGVDIGKEVFHGVDGKIAFRRRIK
jgi:hypothetical protein